MLYATGKPAGRQDYAAAAAAYEQALAAIAAHDPKRGFARLVPEYTHALVAARRLAGAAERR
ncbi:hypothetical protein EBR56_05215 [bacterium]|nr:hypothetical protein [bacterium]